MASDDTATSDSDPGDESETADLLAGFGTARSTPVPERVVYRVFSPFRDPPSGRPTPNADR